MPEARSMRGTTVLLVEDSPSEREVLASYLSAQGIDVQAVGTAEEFRDAVEQRLPDVALLDVSLPEDARVEEGFALARWLRARSRLVGIIMVSGADGLVDRVLGLESGADDYVTKPFDPRELVARIRAVQRRLPRQAPPSGEAAEPAVPPGCVRVGAVVLDPARRVIVRRTGTEERLAAGEFELLSLLVRHPHRPLHRDWLLESTSGDAEPDALERAIDLRIMRLRRKVERDPAHPRAIRTVHGVGYVFVPEAE